MIWRWIHYFSLDVACGAVVSSLLLARVTQQVLPWEVLTALVIAVLLIYHIDHYYDVMRIRQILDLTCMSEKRKFHWRHRTTLLASIKVLLLAGFILLFYLPYTLIILGGGCAIVVSIYLFFVHNHVSFLKEPVIAIIYVIALALWPVHQAIYDDLELTPIFYCDSLLLIGIALLNLLILSLFEHSADELEHSSSWLTHYNQQQTRIFCLYLAGILLGCHLLSFFILLWTPNHNIWIYYDQWILLAMSITLSFIILYPSFSKKNHRYRLWGELIFCYPIVMECLQYFSISL